MSKIYLKGKITQHQNGWKECILTLKTGTVRGYGSTNILALNDAFRGLELGKRQIKNNQIVTTI